MNKLVIIIVAILIISGAAIMAIPFLSAKNVEDKQDKLKNTLSEQIKENAKEQESGEKTYQAETYNPDLVAESINDLTLEENEGEVVVNDDLLKNQKVIGQIVIPKIGVDFAVVEGTSRENLAVAIGYMKGTAGIGGEGNCVLAGHNGGIYGKFFKELNSLAVSDKVEITNLYGTKYIYEVYETFKVTPSDVEVVKNLEGKCLTLITCNDKGKTRFIVRAKLLQ